MGQSLIKLTRQRPLQKTDQNIQSRDYVVLALTDALTTELHPQLEIIEEVGMETVKAGGTESAARLCLLEMSDYTHKVLPTWLPRLDYTSPSGSSSTLTAIICQMKTVSGWILQLSDRRLLLHTQGYRFNLGHLKNFSLKSQ